MCCNSEGGVGVRKLLELFKSTLAQLTYSEPEHPRNMNYMLNFILYLEQNVCFFHLDYVVFRIWQDYISWYVEINFE